MSKVPYIILFQRGATSWGFSLGPFWAYWPFIRFMRVGCWPTCGYDKDWNKDYD